MSPKREAPKEPGSNVGSLSSPEELLEALRATYPDLELVDAGVVVDGRHIADLVARAGDRWLLVRSVEGRGRAAARAALDLFAHARRAAPWLAHHVGLTTDAPPLVVLVAPRFGRALRERLAALSGDALVLLEVHHVESARGRALLALPATAARAPAGAPRPVRGANGTPRAVEARRPAADGRGEGFELLAARLDPADRGVGRDLAERIERIDPELTRSASGDALVWSLGGRELCSLEVEDGRLIGRLFGSEVTHRLSTPFAADHFLDWVLAAHLEVTGAGESPPRGEASGEPRTEEGEGSLLDRDELRPAPPEPLLTPEEIEAFRE